LHGKLAVHAHRAEGQGVAGLVREGGELGCGATGGDVQAERLVEGRHGAIGGRAAQRRVAEAPARRTQDPYGLVVDLHIELPVGQLQDALVRRLLLHQLRAARRLAGGRGLGEDGVRGRHQARGPHTLFVPERRADSAGGQHQRRQQRPSRELMPPEVQVPPLILLDWVPYLRQGPRTWLLCLLVSGHR